MNSKLLQYLETLVAFNSVSNNQPAVLDLLEYVSDELRRNGFNDVLLHNNSGIYSLTASTMQTAAPKVLLQAHIDVVPAPSDLRYKVVGDKVYGRGVFDMLFAVASYLTFISDHSHVLQTLDIGVMLTGDEELGGEHGVKALLDQGYRSDVCILPDAGAGFGDLNVAAKGIYLFTLVANGVAHHGSRPWEGDGAGNKLIHMLNELIALFDMSDQENSTITIATLSGGDADNKGPKSAQAQIDIRYKDQADFTRIQQKVKDLTLKYGASVEAMTIGDSYELDPANPYIASFMQLYEQHAKQSITMMRAPGSSDARFFAARGIPAIMLRPDGYGAHGDNEWLSISSFGKFHTLLEAYILDSARTQNDQLDQSKV